MVALDPNTWTNDDVRSVRTGHEYLLGSPDELNPGPLFIGYDPHRVASQVNLKKESMAYGQGNIAGYRQRAWLVWWALKELWMSGEIGLELGAAGVKTPWCLSTDSQTGRRSYYPKEKPEEDREVVQGHLRVSVEDLSIFQPGTFRAIFAAHVMEHIPGNPLLHFMAVLQRLQPGGGFVGIMPDQDYFDVLASDYTHKHAFRSQQYLREIIHPACAEIPAKVEEFTTFDTGFAYFWAVRRA